MGQVDVCRVAYFVVLATVVRVCLVPNNPGVVVIYSAVRRYADIYCGAGIVAAL